LTDENADPMKRPTTVVGITKVAGDIGNRDGLYGVLEVLASINVFVGLFNLLPLLPLTEVTPLSQHMSEFAVARIASIAPMWKKCGR
jgi:hypothetical protein